MRRHAGAEVEGDAVEMIARTCRAVRSALLQAGDVRIAIIPAARALREIAAERGEMPDLRRRQTLRRSGNAGIGRDNAGVGGDSGNRGGGADAQGPVCAPQQARHVRVGGDIEQRSGRYAAAASLGKVGAGGAEFWGFGGGHGCLRHAAALPLSADIRRSGRIGNSVSRMPVALQRALATAGEVGTVATSPIPTLPPSTWPNPPSSKCTSMSGVSEMPGMR